MTGCEAQRAMNVSVVQSQDVSEIINLILSLISALAWLNFLYLHVGRDRMARFVEAYVVPLSYVFGVILGATGMMAINKAFRCGEMLCAHTFRYKPRVTFMDVRVTDGNRVLNARVTRQFFKKEVGEGSLLMHGFTKVGEEKIPFPIYADPKQIVHFMQELNKLPTFHKRKLMLENWITPEVYVLLRPLFVFKFLASIAFTKFQVFTILVTSYFGGVVWFVGLIPLTMLCDYFGPDSIMYVAFEELLNHYCGIVPIVLIETLSRIHLMDVPSLVVPALIHLCLSYLPLPVSLILHWRINVWIVQQRYASMSCSVEDVSAQAIDFVKLHRGLIHETAFWTDVARKIVNKDLKGLLLSLMMRAEIVELWKFFEFDNLTEFVKELFTTTDTTDGLVVLNSDEERYKTRDILLSWLPVGIRRSPTFSKLVGLLSMMMLSKWFTSLEAFNIIGDFFNAKDFECTTEIASVAVSAATGVYRGLKRVLETGSFSAFFDKPRDVEFLENAYELLAHGAEEKLTRKDLVLQMDLIQGLLDSRKFCVNSVTIERALSDLRTLLKKRENFKRTWESRRQPMAIWLNGTPGGGKSTLIETLCDIISKLDGDERFLGDIVPVILEDKYPTNISAHICGKFLVLNDIAKDYTEYPKADKMPLDLALQVILDTTPCTFRAAAIEDKGKVLNEVSVAILTSNHVEYKMAGETRKLQRRLKSGVVVDMYFFYKGRNVEYETICKLPQGERNDCTRFKVLNVKCDDKHVGFSPSQLDLSYSEFFAYVKLRYLEHKEAAQASFAKFSAFDAPRCACGIVEAYHITSSKKGRVEHPQGEVDETFQEQCEECVVPRKYKWYIPFVSKSRTATLSVEDFVMPTAVLLLAFMWFSALFGSWWIYRHRVELMQQGIERLKIEASVRTYDLIKDRPLLKRLYIGSFHGLKGYVQYEYLVARKKMHELREFLTNHAFAVGIASAATLLMVALKMQEEAAQELAKPIYAEQVKPNSIEFGPATSERSFPVATTRSWGSTEKSFRKVLLQTRGVGREDLERVARNALSWMDLRFDTKPGAVKAVQVLEIAPGFLCFNKHYVMDKGKYIARRFSLTSGDVVQVFFVEDLKSSPYNEFFIIEHSFPRSKSLLHFLPNHPISQQVSIVHIKLDGSFEAVASPVNVKISGATYQSLMWVEPPQEGMCSEPVIGEVAPGEWCLIGAVGHGLNGCTGITLFSKEWFSSLVAEEQPIVEEVIVELPSKMTVLPLKEQAEIRNLDSPYVVAIGSTNTLGRSFTTSLRPTMVCNEFQAKLSEPVLPPLKLNAVVDGEYKSAFLHTVKNVNMSCDLTDEEMRTCVDSMMPKFKDLISAHSIKLSPISLSEAFFGADDLGIERIDFKSSMGAFMRELGVKNKYDVFIETATDEYEVKPEFMDRVKMYHEMFMKGQTPAHFSEMVPKDELRSISKVRNCKIRLFSVMDGAFNMYARMYLMPLLIILLRFPEVSECYGGMNAGSSQWHKLAMRLKKEKRFFFDMDFSTFDWSHGAKKFKAAARFFYLLAKLAGYSEEDARIVRLIFLSFQWQTSSYKGDLFMKYKGMPSGVLFTLALNSFVNSFLLRVAWLRLVGDLTLFDQKVDTANVGDDNLSSADVEYKDKFNMITISEVYARLGYVATPAKKDAEIATDIPFEDLSFLKRRFLMNEEIGEYVAPIEKDSIYKAFCYEKRDASITPAQRLVDVAGGAQREAFLHGRDYFQQFQTFVEDTFSSKGLTFEKLDYESLMNEYKSNEFRTFMLSAPELMERSD